VLVIRRFRLGYCRLEPSLIEQAETVRFGLLLRHCQV